MHQHQHTRRHHRSTQRLWRRRRWRTLSACFWVELRPQDVDTHAPKRLYGKKEKYRRRVEERRFRQRVRRALHHDEPMPRYRHDWAD